MKYYEATFKDKPEVVIVETADDIKVGDCVLGFTMISPSTKTAFQDSQPKPKGDPFGGKKGSGPPKV